MTTATTDHDPATHGDTHHGHDDHADHGHGADGLEAAAQGRIAEIDHILDHQADELLILTDAQVEAKQDKLKRLMRHRQRIAEFGSFTFRERTEQL